MGAPEKEIKRSDGWLGSWKWGRVCLVISRDDLWAGWCWEREEGMLYFAPLPAVIFGFRVRDPVKTE